MKALEQLIDEMLAAGWRRKRGTGFTYIHPDGGQVNLLQPLAGRHYTLWRWYVEWELLPSTTLGPEE